jgi:hypothetical protein
MEDNMTLPMRDRQASFFDVSFLAENLFGPDDPYTLFRKEILPALEAKREDLCRMYCADNGRTSIEPVILAGVTLLQFMETAPDRRAGQNVRLHLGWKHALDLPVNYKGFHATNLVHFRNRLLEHDQDRLAFDAILQQLHKKGLVKRAGKQRLDSTHILGLVSRMSRLELTRETIRLFLEVVQRLDLQGKLSGWDLLRDRYIESDIPWHKLSKERLIEKFQEAGADMWDLVRWSKDQPALKDHEKTQLLQRVFDEQFEICDQKALVRKAENSGGVKNPHDPDAQWASKDPANKTAWVGYKSQIAETVPEAAQPGIQPTKQFITEVTTTEAIASDFQGRREVEKNQQEHGLGVADELYVDSAYINDDVLAEAAEQGRTLMGPARPSCNQSGGPSAKLFKADEFDVSVADRKAVCPAGRASTQCSRLEDEKTGDVGYRFEWSYQCDECFMKAQCTKAESGRRMLVVGEHHDHLQDRRRRMRTDEFKQAMYQRNAIEGTISEFARGGGRRSRYRGLPKTSLANYFHGAAINVKRWIRLMQYQMGQEVAVAV